MRMFSCFSDLRKHICTLQNALPIPRRRRATGNPVRQNGCSVIEQLEVRSLLSADLQLVDINPLPEGNSFPRGFTVIQNEPVNINGIAYFSAFSPTGTELWKSDGTVEGTVLVKNICQFPQSIDSSLPQQLTNVNGTLFFVANDNIHGFELWKSDGTAEGTVMVRDISPGLDGSISAMQSLTAVGDKLYFSRGDLETGVELWRSDGTEAGTIRITDLAPGDFSSVPQNLTNVNGTLFFSARDIDQGLELYKVDPVTEIVTLVKEIYPGETGSQPNELTNVNGTLYFVATDPEHGQELWKSDGTAVGTVMIKDVYPGTFGVEPRSSLPRQLVNFNGTLFFSAQGEPGGHELWRSDGTEAGTFMVKEVSEGFSSQGPEELTVVDDTLFFSGEDAVAGYELWASDGTTEGTRLVKDIRPLTIFGNESNPRFLTDVNGELYFVADDGTHGKALWRSDGTTGGTQLVADIEPDTNGFGPQFLTSLNGKLLFTANDGANGEELWLLTPSTIDPLPDVTLDVSQSNLNESGGISIVTATLSQSADVDVTIVLGLSGTATMTDDYSLSTNQIVIPAGSSTGSVSLSAIQDSLDETNETVLVEILDVTSANESGTQQATVTINDDDLPPTVTLAISPAEIVETGGTATITATLSAISSLDVTTNLSFGGTAIASDYAISDTIIIIPAGETIGSVLLTAIQDDLTEATESIIVDIVSVTNGTEQGSQSQTATILTTDVGITIGLNQQPLNLAVSAKNPLAIDRAAALTSTSGSALAVQGAVLRVSGQNAKDTVLLLKENGISAKGKKVLFEKTVIGTIAGGKKGAGLTVQFNAMATQNHVQRVIRTVAFKSKDKQPGLRTIRIQLTNVDGVDTNIASRQIQITAE